MKSEICFEEMLGQYLPSQIVEDNLLNNQNTGMSSYEFYKYGLSNQLRVTPRKKCERCKGGDGETKQGYPTEQEARNTAEVIYEAEGKCLRVYKCKHKGWHLTKIL